MDNLPTPLRHNPNGWTAERQAAFIAALGDTASVTAAAARVGMTRQSANWLRRQPASVGFRAAWDAALADVWMQVEATALERVMNGEVETFERDGVTVTRHRPCAPRLLVHMVDRAVARREKAESLAQAAAKVEMDGRVSAMRAEIYRLAELPHDLASDDDEPDHEPLPAPIDAATRACRHLDDLTQGFLDCPGDADAASPEAIDQKPPKAENVENAGGSSDPDPHRHAGVGQYHDQPAAIDADIRWHEDGFHEGKSPPLRPNPVTMLG